MTPQRNATPTPVTGPTCSRCGAPSRDYQESCGTCQARKRQHRKRARDRAERAKHKPGRLLVVSSGGGVGRIVWRAEERCGASALQSMVEGMRARYGDPDLELLREIPCGMDAGHAVCESAAVIVDEHQGDPVRWHDLESVRDRLDELEPRPERPVFDSGICQYGGLVYQLTECEGDGAGVWRLMCDGAVRWSSTALPGSRMGRRQAEGWARVTVASGWPVVTESGTAIPSQQPQRARPGSVGALDPASTTHRQPRRRQDAEH